MLKHQTKSVIKYVIPSVIGSCSFFLFTTVDTIFVGRGVGPHALGAVSLTAPFVMLLNAMVLLAAVGGATVTAVRIGRGDTEGANQVFMHSLLCTLLIAAIMCGIGVFLTKPVMRLLGANDTFIDLTTEYLFWYACFAVPIGLFIFLRSFVRNDGSPKLVSIAAITASAINIVLDYIFVFPLQKGLMGAAVATGISQIIGSVILLSHFILKRGQLRICVVPLVGSVFKKVFVRGLPEAISQLAIPITTLCMNMILLKAFGDIAVNAFSVVQQIVYFAISIFLGTAEGLQPLLGRCYGEKKEKDLKYYFHAGLCINLVSSVVISMLLLLCSRPIFGLFGMDNNTIDFAVDLLPKYIWGLIAVAPLMMTSAYLYSTKRTGPAVTLNVCRSIVFNTIVIFSIPVFFGTNAVWFAMGIYEAMALILAFALLKSSEKNGVIFK